jgi:hypothetical protein
LRNSQHFSLPKTQAELSSEKKRHHRFSRELPNIAEARFDIVTVVNMTVTVLVDVTLFGLVVIYQLSGGTSSPSCCACLTFLP